MTDIVEQLKTELRLCKAERDRAQKACEQIAERAEAKMGDLSTSLENLLCWCEALAIVGSVTPEAWIELEKLVKKARAALGEKE